MARETHGRDHLSLRGACYEKVRENGQVRDEVRKQQYENNRRLTFFSFASISYYRVIISLGKTINHAD